MPLRTRRFTPRPRPLRVPRSLQAGVLAACVLGLAPGVAQEARPGGAVAVEQDPVRVEPVEIMGPEPASQDSEPAFQPRQIIVPPLTATGYGFVPREIQVPALTATGYGFVPRVIQVPVLHARGDTGAPTIDIAQPSGPAGQPQPAEPGVSVPDVAHPEAAEPGVSVPAGGGEPIVTDTLRMTGTGPADRHPQAYEPGLIAPQRVVTETLRMTGRRGGDGEAPVATGEARFTLLRVVPLTPGDLGTNPFDFRDLRADVLAAQTPAAAPAGAARPVVTPVTPVAGPVTPPAGATPLALVTGLPFEGAFPESVLTIHVDAAGADTLSVTEIGPGIGTTAALQTTFNGADGSGTTALFAVMPGWTLASRSHPDPVSQAVDPVFVLRRDADGLFFRLVVGFSTLPATANVRIDALSGVRCGASAGDCP